MYFPADELEKIKDEYQSIFGKHQKLLDGYLTYQYTDARAKEFATHGFSRRLGTLVRCIEKVYEILPPDRIELPTTNELRDAAINIQASVFNVFGCTDNLAWIWVTERKIGKGDGSVLPDQWVGLRPKNEHVRQSFSQEFQIYLTSLNGWFDNLENFRHALAHRIPLYVPPYTVPHDREADYRELERQMSEALKKRDYAKHKRLSAEQKALCVFRPWMTHSFHENAHHVVFHAQLLADFNTIDELGQKMLIELGR